jgi:hypothetical protein
VDEATQRLSKLHWPALGRELSQRTTQPISHPSFVIFFIVVIFGVVPTGFWIELYSYYASGQKSAATLRTSFISVVPAFVAATTLQLIWAENEKRSLRAFSIFALSTCMLGLVFCASEAISNNVALFWGSVSAVIALWMWWIANANQRELMDEQPDISHDYSIGGALSNSPLAGSLDEFQT